MRMGERHKAHAAAEGNGQHDAEEAADTEDTDDADEADDAEDEEDEEDVMARMGSWTEKLP